MNMPNPSGRESFFGKLLTQRHFLTWSFVLPVILLVLGGGIALAVVKTIPKSNSENSEIQPDLTILPVEVMKVNEVKSFRQYRAYTGMIYSRRSSDLSFDRPSGKLMAVLVEEGDIVQKGQVLAHLDTRALQSKKSQVLAQLQEAKAVLTELETGARKEVKAASAAQVRDLQAQGKLLELVYRRQEQLLSTNAVSQQEFDQAKYNWKAVEAKLAVAKAQLDELENGTRIEKILAQKSRVQALEADLESVQVDLEDSILKAPFAGQIARRNLDEGTIVSANKPVLRLVEHQDLEARFGIPSHLVSQLKPGQKMDILVEGKNYKAIVTGILPELDLKTRTRPIILTLPREGKSPVVPGQVARIHLQETIQTTGFWLPSSALQKGSRGLWTAYGVVSIDRKEVIERRDVEILFTQGNRVLVRGTIVPGDRIVPSGLHRIVPGQVVRSRIVTSVPTPTPNPTP
ncbi:MAG: efflux RND transporter periplasmic adaptor subunit [Bdellovibrionales bacterium]